MRYVKLNYSFGGWKRNGFYISINFDPKNIQHIRERIWIKFKKALDFFPPVKSLFCFNIVFNFKRIFQKKKGKTYITFLAEVSKKVYPIKNRKSCSFQRRKFMFDDCFHLNNKLLQFIFLVHEPFIDFQFAYYSNISYSTPGDVLRLSSFEYNSRIRFYINSFYFQRIQT